jgi:hypothetical protein
MEGADTDYNPMICNKYSVPHWYSYLKWVLYVSHSQSHPPVFQVIYCVSNEIYHKINQLIGDGHQKDHRLSDLSLFSQDLTFLMVIEWWFHQQKWWLNQQTICYERISWTMIWINYNDLTATVTRSDGKARGIIRPKFRLVICFDTDRIQI